MKYVSERTTQATGTSAQASLMYVCKMIHVHVCVSEILFPKWDLIKNPARSRKWDVNESHIWADIHMQLMLLCTTLWLRKRGMFSWTSVLPLPSLWGFYIRLNNNIKGQFGVSDDLKQPLLWPYFLGRREAGKKFEQYIFIRIFMLVKKESISNLDLI